MKRNQDAVKTARESRERDQRPLSTGTARGLVVQDRLLIGVGACAGVIALASNAFQSIYQQVSGTAVETALPIWGNIAYAGQIALMLFVVLGVYLAQRSGFGRFGTVASAIALLGTMLWAAACVHQFLDVLAVSPGTAPEPPGRVIVVMMSFFALHAIGLLMLGIATWRARILPKTAAIMLTLGVLLGLTIESATPLVLLVYCSGAAWLGLAAFRVVTAGTRGDPGFRPVDERVTSSAQASL
jgi:hypothetical protein